MSIKKAKQKPKEVFFVIDDKHEVATPANWRSGDNIETGISAKKDL